MTKYKALSYSVLSENPLIYEPVHLVASSVEPDSPAYTVMTDFYRTTPFAIEPTATIGEANDKMIACGVRTLFVTNSAGGVLGIVTSSDILGEKPVQYLNEHGGGRQDILVLDVMTPREQFEPVDYQDVLNATVGDIVETLKTFGRQHVLVLERGGPDQRDRIRGMFSTTQVGRQLGVELQPSGKAHTFARLELALASG